MKPDNKLGHLEFEPERAFDNLRKLARAALAVPKAAIQKKRASRPKRKFAR
jgi:hypothetical protein